MEKSVIYILECDVAGRPVCMSRTEYTDAEMQVAFNDDERAKLSQGRMVWRMDSFGHWEFVDARAGFA